MRKWIPVLLLLSACKSRSQTSENILSVIVFTDSVLAYTGPLTVQTKINSIFLNKKNIQALIASSIKNRGEDLKVLVKPAWYANAGGNAEDIVLWGKATGFANIRTAPVDSMDEVVLKVTGPKFDTNGIAVDMKLNLPRDDQDTAMVKTTAKTYTVLLLNNNLVYLYAGTDIANKIFYGGLSDPLFRSALVNGRKKYGQDYVVVLKPSESATYKNTVDVLDEMLINDIKKYAMVSIRSDEIEFAQTLAQP